MAAARGLAVDGDEIGLGLAQPGHPGGEARLEPIRVERAEHGAQRVVAGDARGVGPEAAQEGQLLLAPELDLDEIVRAGQGGAEQEQQDLGQGVEHLGLLPRVLQGREPVEQQRAGGLGHGRLLPGRSPSTRTLIPPKPAAAIHPIALDAGRAGLAPPPFFVI
jgi:hypothetical protein